MFDMKNFSKNLYKLRRENKMTQLQLSKKLNVTRQTISKYEVGDSFPDIQILVLLSEIFNITIGELITRESGNLKNKNELDSAETGDVFNEFLKSMSQINFDIENDNFESITEDLLKKYIPFLNERAKQKIFEKIIKHDISCDLLSEILLHSNSKNMMRLIEYAVLDGAIDKDALNYVYDKIKKQVKEEELNSKDEIKKFTKS